MMLKRWRWFCLTCFIFLFNIVICNSSNHFCCWIRELLCYLTCSRTTLGTKFNDLRLWLMQRAISSRCWWKELMGLCFSPRDENPCVIFMVSVWVPDVRFKHVIKLFTRKYNRIVFARSCVFHKHLKDFLIF